MLLLDNVTMKLNQQNKTKQKTSIFDDLPLTTLIVDFANLA